MPELPEVEYGRSLLEEHAVGRRIEQTKSIDDRIVFAGVTPARFSRTLKQRHVVAACRRGKYLWLELDRPPHPIFHFGMTGAFVLPDRDPLPLESSAQKPDQSWPPRFAKFVMTLDNGATLAFVNKRRLGRIRLSEQPLKEPPVSELGFDPLTDLPNLHEFRDLLLARKAPLKSLLLDQSFAAGVGNWIADEVLYQAGIDPKRRPGDLDHSEIRQLRLKLKSVIQKAVEVGADKTRFPKKWLFHRRWGRDDSETLDGLRIEKLTLGGRTTAWVPDRQR